jgi:hypothetical protein
MAWCNIFSSLSESNTSFMKNSEHFSNEIKSLNYNKLTSWQFWHCKLVYKYRDWWSTIHSNTGPGGQLGLQWMITAFYGTIWSKAIAKTTNNGGWQINQLDFCNVNHMSGNLFKRHYLLQLLYVPQLTQVWIPVHQKSGPNKYWKYGTFWQFESILQDQVLYSGWF